MTPEKESRLKELHVEAVSKIKASFETSNNFLKFLYDCNSFLLMKIYDRRTAAIAPVEEYTEIYECLCFSNELLNDIGIRWSNNKLETEDQQHTALRGFLDTIHHKPDIYSKRVTGLLSVFLTNEYDNQPTYSLYARGFAALFDVNVILNTIEKEKLLELPELTEEEKRKKLREILERIKNRETEQMP